MTEVPLPADHAWTARPGFKVVVADRGAARFDVPEDWVADADGEGDLRLHDRPPPDDECRVELTLLPFRLAPGAEPPLEALLDAVTAPEALDVMDRTTPATVRRDGLAVVWRETRHRDPGTGRAALSRILLARGAGLHAVLTMDLWSEDAGRFEPAWQELLHSLQLGARYDLTGRDPERN